MRRSLSCSFVVLACAFVWAAAPVLLPLALLVDLGIRRRFVLARTYVMVMVALICESVGVAVALTLELALALGVDRQRVLARSFQIQCLWVAALARSAFAIFSVRLEVEGAEAIGDGPLLVFMRHASTADALLPGLLISGPRGIVLRYVLKHELLWDPCLDLVGNQLENYFVQRGVGSEQEIEGVARLADNLGREGVLIYPEGTRFGLRKRARILEKLEAAGDERGVAQVRALTHVLPPRHGGPLALLERGRGVDVLFCAHTGLEGTVSFASLLRGQLIGTVIRVRFWRVPAREIPEGRDDRIVWLHGQWEQVNGFVAAQDSGDGS
ncbi:lysophospholipid acyltransferase family protein [Enhygromyxa salina]|uniref:lysophospholipid acyltransferase family protein n=1 Tax=Enhygromyxa salina TaxID=215803 RepID=UPI0011B227AD|nr:lysophospholipid acyltransferase family protein [Enhygromyxa salina]